MDDTPPSIATHRSQQPQHRQSGIVPGTRLICSILLLLVPKTTPAVDGVIRNTSQLRARLIVVWSNRRRGCPHLRHCLSSVPPLLFASICHCRCRMLPCRHTILGGVLKRQRAVKVLPQFPSSSKGTTSTPTSAFCQVATHVVTRCGIACAITAAIGRVARRRGRHRSSDDGRGRAASRIVWLACVRHPARDVPPATSVAICLALCPPRTWKGPRRPVVSDKAGRYPAALPRRGYGGIHRALYRGH